MDNSLNEDSNDSMQEYEEHHGLETENTDAMIEFVKVEYAPKNGDIHRFVDETNKRLRGTDVKFKRRFEPSNASMYRHRKFQKKMILVSEEETVKFIKAVKKFPELWYKKNPKYHCKDAHLKAWETLSLAFGVSIDDLREKWKSLRNMFRNNLQKIRQSRLAGLTPYQPIWYAYAPMQFILKNNEDIISESALGSSENAALELINTVKVMPELWQRKSPKFQSLFSQQKAWKSVSSSLGLPIAEVKEKWHNLRETFLNIQSSLKKNESTKTMIHIKPTWFAYEAMQFLKENDDDIEETNTINENPTCLPRPDTSKAPTIDSSQSSIQFKQYDSVAIPNPAKSIRVTRRKAKIPSIASTPEHSIPIELSSEAIAFRCESPQSKLRTDDFDRSSNAAVPLIAKALDNITNMTNKFMQSKNSPYSGFLTHLDSILARKRTRDFDQIEAILLNCLNEISKFPNVSISSTVNYSVSEVDNETEILDQDDPSEDFNE